jgi:hypothetical protein
VPNLTVCVEPEDSWAGRVRGCSRPPALECRSRRIPFSDVNAAEFNARLSGVSTVFGLWAYPGPLASPHWPAVHQGRTWDALITRIAHRPGLTGRMARCHDVVTDALTHTDYAHGRPRTMAGSCGRILLCIS